jgi:hypothetical protein
LCLSGVGSVCGGYCGVGIVCAGIVWGGYSEVGIVWGGYCWSCCSVNLLKCTETHLPFLNGTYYLYIPTHYTSHTHTRTPAYHKMCDFYSVQSESSIHQKQPITSMNSNQG